MAGLAFLLWAGMAWGQSMMDRYADRVVLLDPAGSIAANNTGASREPNEPRHGSKPGGHSLWVSWVAPTNGLATFSTPDPGFDTVVAVYREESGDGNPLDRLESVVDDDDYEGGRGSQLQFAVRAGRRYEIAVDGYGGATGPFVLAWDFLSASNLIPAILQMPPDQTVVPGDTLVLAARVEPLDDAHYRWFLNDVALTNATATSLVVSNVGLADLGHYRLRISVEDVRFFSPAVEVQLNTEGATNVLARDKMLDAADAAQGLGLNASGAALSPAGRLVRQGGPQLQGPSPGVLRGYAGSQLWSTLYTQRDPLEPAHCGVDHGPTCWLAYQPPEAGIVNLNTLGSAFPTVLAVYTYDPPLTSYADLRSVACDSRGAPDGTNSVLEFAADPARTYFVVVGGDTYDTGVAQLNYELIATGAASNLPPVIGEPPQHAATRPGGSAQFAVTAGGTPPLRYHWLRDGERLPGQTNATLLLSNLQPTDARLYAVVVTNAYGLVTSSPAPLHVLEPPTLGLAWNPGTASILLSAEPGVRYSLEASTALHPTNWVSIALTTATTQGVVALDVPSSTNGFRYFRLRAD